MSRQKTRFLVSFVITLLVLFAVILISGAPTLRENTPENIEKYVVIETQSGQTHRFDVELALTLEEVRQGLMHRNSLDQDKGMFFIFGASEERKFWMKNTRIPLDMIFIRSNGQIHKIHRDARPFDETLITSEGPVLAVLEINAGLTERLQIEKGDIVHHSEFGNQIKN